MQFSAVGGCCLEEAVSRPPTPAEQDSRASVWTLQLERPVPWGGSHAPETRATGTPHRMLWSDRIGSPSRPAGWDVPGKLVISDQELVTLPLRLYLSWWGMEGSGTVS